MHHRLVYGLDIETNAGPGSGDPLDPLASPVRTAVLSTARGDATFRGDEESILDDLDETLRNLEPGILATWNGGAFDLPYLADRASMWGLHLGLRLAADPRLRRRGDVLRGHTGAYRGVVRPPPPRRRQALPDGTATATRCGRAAPVHRHPGRHRPPWARGPVRRAGRGAAPRGGARLPQQRRTTRADPGRTAAPRRGARRRSTGSRRSCDEPNPTDPAALGRQRSNPPAALARTPRRAGHARCTGLNPLRPAVTAGGHAVPRQRSPDLPIRSRPPHVWSLVRAPRPGGTHVRPNFPSRSAPCTRPGTTRPCGRRDRGRRSVADAGPHRRRSRSVGG